jgi:hypothetical protein
MKIVNVCDAPLLACEVHNILKTDPRNALAFTERDPLENPEITNPDHLRRLVAARRTVGYIEGTLRSQEVVPKSNLRALKAEGLSNDHIARLADNRSILSTPESAQVYIPLILGDMNCDAQKLREILFQEPVEEEPATKRRTSVRKK